MKSAAKAQSSKYPTELLAKNRVGTVGMYGTNDNDNKATVSNGKTVEQFGYVVYEPIMYNHPGNPGAISLLSQFQKKMQNWSHSQFAQNFKRLKNNCKCQFCFCISKIERIRINFT